jgi:hypothetical protein
VPSRGRRREKMREELKLSNILIVSSSLSPCITLLILKTKTGAQWETRFLLNFLRKKDSRAWTKVLKRV